MKQVSTFLFVFILLINVNVSLQAQNNAFSVKKKLPGSTKVSPQPIHPFNTAKKANSVPQSQFQPLQANFSTLKLDRQVFSNPGFNANGRLVFVEGRLPSTGKSVGKALTEKEECAEYLTALQQVLEISNPSSEFEIVKSEYDEIGMQHIKLAQKFMGIPVYGGEIYLHKRNGSIDLFNGNSYPTPSINSVVPVIAESFASESAISDLSSRTSVRELLPNEKTFLSYNGPQSELVIYHKGGFLDAGKLTWHITVRPNFIERWEYFVDAKSGEIIHQYNNTQSDGDVTASGVDLNGVSRSFHSFLQAGTYSLADLSRPMYNDTTGSGIIATYDANNTSYGDNFAASLVSSSNNSWLPTAVSAHYSATVTYEYYKNIHSWNSINNKRASIPMIINVTDKDGSSMENAFWNGVAAYFGNGGSTFKPLAGGLDVGAHELGHAVVGNSANLEYQNQSGALNESFADISGAMLDREDWRIGEDVINAGAAGFPTGALRDMSDPHNGGSGISSPSWQPAHMNEIYSGTADNGGVHTNSGIPNYAYYKFATQVTREKAEKVFFRALFNYLTRSSQFIDLRLTVIQAATDLYGSTSAEVTAAKNAFDQVGITDGTATNVENPIPVNPGSDYILLVNTYALDPYSLYVSNTIGTQFTPISLTPVNSRPSVMDDGSGAVFVTGDKTIQGINLTSPYDEFPMQSQAIWGNVAISKEGEKIAAVTNAPDSTIWVYSFQKEKWAYFHLYNPGTQTGIRTDNVLYADALEWTFDGEYIMYDAYNQFNNNSGQAADYWDVSFIKVWDNATGDWGDGSVFKMFTNLPENVSIGNPSFAKNSPYIAAFDYFDNSGTVSAVTILSVNLETGDVGEVYNNGEMLGYPNYSKNDDKIIFNATTGTDNVVGEISMLPDKINPAGPASLLIQDAKWGVWYSTGIRAVGIVPEVIAKNRLQVYPNPTSSKASIDLSDFNQVEGLIELFDISGKKFTEFKYAALQSEAKIDFSTYNKGVYLLKVSNAKATSTMQVIRK
ncbi:MAG: M4 family metallopeptidase [Bacteroidales bacterium]|nr:M4 family metallopeptidase [Bacteroidales bacterium]